MCWTSNIIKPLEVASHDIPVFKICCDFINRVVPYYYDNNTLKYVEGETYSVSKLDVTHVSDKVFIGRGFHSYEIGSRVLEEGSRDNFRVTYKPRGWQQVDGFGLNPKLSWQEYRNSICVVVLCVIPKGCTYAINESGECVSDKLRVVKILRDYSVFNKNSIERLNYDIVSFGKSYG